MALGLQHAGPARQQRSHETDGAKKDISGNCSNDKPVHGVGNVKIAARNHDEQHDVEPEERERVLISQSQ
jgi:hypothetical protein